MRIIRVAASIAVLSLTIAGCGDDDDDGDLALYCERTAELDGQEGPPTEEQIDGIEEVAPEEIEADVSVVADEFRAAIESGDFESLFEDDETVERLESIEEFEDENCPEREDEDEGDGDGGEEGEQGAAEPAEGANVVTVTATEYAFAVPAGPIAAGSTALQLQNDGEEDHELSIGQLLDGHTLDEVLQHQGDPFAAGLVGEPSGSTGDVAPGESLYLNVDLPAGQYAMVCFLETPDGTPHAFEGMATTFEVA